MVEGGDAVVGLIERSKLSAALATIHRNGQGHNARVLDAARGEVKGQLRRAGVAADLDLDTAAGDTVVILIHAPGRTEKTVELLERAGATSVRPVSRLGAEVPHPFVVPAPASKRSRIASASEVATD